MAILSFKDYLVWQKGHQMVLSVYEVSRWFPKEELYGITSQIRRAAISVCANIAEGYLKGNKEFRRYLDIALGSNQEVRYYLLLVKDLGFIESREYTILDEQNDEIGKMLSGMREKLLISKNA
jgi:four helix bundle protein